MTSRSKGMIPIKFPFVHVVLSHFTVMFCTISFFEDDRFVRTGKLETPIIYILLAGELLRWSISKFVFGLDASNKEYSTSGSRLVQPRNVSIVTHVKNILKLCALLGIFIAVYCIVCVILGASYHSHYEGTLALSLLLTILTILPIGLFLGPSKTIQYLFYDTFELHSPSDIWQLELLQYNAFGSLVGAWAGSVVAPLDWDRSWQVYPIPNVVGAVIGFSFTNIFTFLSSIVQISDRMIDLSLISNEKKTT